MIRRSPTRIELRLDDIQEWELKRREVEARKQAATATTPGVTGHKKEASHERHERIGFVPQPRIS